MNIFYKIFILIFLNGFTSIIAQIILYKEILSQVYANEIVLSFALSAWLIAGAIAGIIIFPKYFKNKNTDFLIIIFVLSVFASILVSIFSLLLIRNIKTLFNMPVEQIMNIWDAAIITMFIYGTSSFIFTLTFSFAGEIIKRSNGDLKLLYIIETTGSIVAGVLFTLFIAGKYSNLELLYWMGIINIAIIYVLSRNKDNTDRIVKSTLVFFMIVYLIPLITGYLKKIDEKSQIVSYSKYEVILKKEGLDSKIAITKRNKEYFVFSNGLLKYQTSPPGNSEFFAWAMLTRKGFKDILLINGGYTGGIKEIKKYKNTGKITVLETDIDAAELMEKLFKDSISSEGIEFVHGDLIYYCYNLNKEKKYDLIILQIPPPNTFLNNRYFTAEFYKLLKNYLNKNGVLVFAMDFAENYMEKQIVYSIAPVYKTVKSIMTNVEIIPGEKIIFIASDEEIQLQPEKILAGLKENNIKIPELNSVYLHDKINRSISVKKILDDSKVKYNKILEPEAYLQNIKKDLMMFAKNANFLKAICIISIFILIFYQLYKLHKKIKIFPYISMLLFSATTIMLELGLILIYQSFYGYLYRSVGLLYSFFMVGILIGTVLFMIFNITNFRITVILAELLNIIILFYILNFKSILQPVNPNIIMFFIIASGFFTGAIFSLMLGESEISILYGADLAGGAAGGIIFGLIIFPFAGFTGIIIFNLLLLAIAYTGGLKNA